MNAHTNVEAAPLLAVSSLSKRFGDVNAVRNVSFEIERGKTFGLVGESGSGKSTVARLVLRLLEPTTGAVHFDGQDIGLLNASKLRSERQHMQMIFQDPYGSLNPRMTVEEIIAEPMLVHNLGTVKDRKATAERLIGEVGLPKSSLSRYPHEFSGGQRQRIAVARALSTRPTFIVADEPVSALDVSVQAQVLNLMCDLRDQYQTTMLFISHDLRVVQFMCDVIAVMYLGQIVEQGPRQRIYEVPSHPYTRALLSSAPGTDRDKRTVLEGEIPSAHNVPKGCAFCTRCPIAENICRERAPQTTQVEDGHSVACHFA
ncbi:ABC transporter ATP-binding protein [Ruegeria sp. HKCCD8929]|uniref:ABC transporter ATP-binding protein n=1 Tax=Ruegeria sp. HKCCD8929 TaxID=2683006 RepID=UPI00148903CC|nr:oligopeptide/dipeptide ABC transporter ATP-binding protein [Ruegeria sp. HKCCD8929]